MRKLEVTQEILDLFEPAEGSLEMYYGQIGNGKTYAATADVLDLVRRGRVVYVNWRINYNGFDERSSFIHLFFKTLFFKDKFIIMASILVKTTDFTGLYYIAQTTYTTPILQAYIDEFEKTYIGKLLG